MRTLSRKTLVAALLAALVITGNSVQAEATSETLGMSATKPESGPYVEVDGGFMVPYTHTIERTAITFEMIPVPGGTVKVGSPEGEEGHNTDEAPQFTVEIPPFWMAKTEVTWAEYKTFMRNYDIFKRLFSRKVRPVDESNIADAVTIPTPLYMPGHTFQYGEDNQQPAVTMTQFAAKQYTKWLSGITSVQYRIPTEAEWEYAARAGSTTAYSFGDDPAELDKYAAFDENAPEGALLVGSKEPNAFGLHDMHGNVWEWTVEQYRDDGYGDREGKTLSWEDAIVWPEGPDFSVARGGGWQDSADRLRSAVRIHSEDEDWKSEDPNGPLSPWWYTSDPSRQIGMRIVRSYNPLDKELIQKFWDASDEDTQADVDFRLKEGRGAIGLPVPELIPEFQRRR